MKKIKRVNQRFVEIYETKIKEYRKDYYKNIVNLTSAHDNKAFYLLINILPIIVCAIIAIMGGFSISSQIFATIVFIISSIVCKIIFKIPSLAPTNNYLKEIMKYGYYSIEDYENKLRKYVTGPDGFYSYLLADIMFKYNISNNTRQVSGIHGELYYIWTNKRQDTLLLLNSRTNERPEIISIRFVNIRYFRVDNYNKEIVLKTDLEEYYFKLDALDTINEYLKEKRFENIKDFKPEDHINDFELYMHKIKSDVINKAQKNKDEYNKYLCQIIFYLIGLVIINFTKVYIKENLALLSLVNFLLFIMFMVNLKKLIYTSISPSMTDDEYIRILNTDEKCKARFNELKFALGIKDSYDRVYSNEGACYLTWVANGYFHIFLNLIYFNVVYMAIRTSDVLYYVKNGHECDVKLRDKTLTFNKDAIEVFSKILPNKDYNWIKGFKNK